MMRFVISCGVSFAVAFAFLVGNGQVNAQPMEKRLEKALADIKAPATPKQPRKLLIYSATRGYRHGSIGIGTKAITELGKKTGAFTVVATEDPSYFAPEKLKEFDAVLMLNTTGDCLSGKGKDQEEIYKQSLADFVEKDGKGLAGIHAACDTYHRWKEYQKLMGAEFAGHPWGEVPVLNCAPKNPVNAAFEGKAPSNNKDGKFHDEIYTFKDGTALATDRRILLCVDNSKFPEGKLKQGPKRADNTQELSWIAKVGKGRNFYCAFGHGDEIYVNPTILQHYLAGIQYVLGDLKADDSPTGVAPFASKEAPKTTSKKTSKTTSK